MPGQTKRQRLKKEQAADAGRQQTRRDKMKEEGRPDTHAIDRAICEAVAWLSIEKQGVGQKRSDVTFSVYQILRVALAILSKQYDRNASARVIRERMARRGYNLWTLRMPKPERDDI